jgi:hypothetical protein
MGSTIAAESRRPVSEHLEVVSHAKSEHRMGRNHLAGPAGDAVNALAAAGYNFGRQLAWLALLWATFLLAQTAWRHHKVSLSLLDLRSSRTTVELGVTHGGAGRAQIGLVWPSSFIDEIIAYMKDDGSY